MKKARITLFAEKIKFTEFFSGKGKPWNKADNFCLIVRKHDEARERHEVAEHFCRKSFCGKNCFQEIVTNRKSAKIILRSYTKVKYGLAQTILMR